MTNKTISLKEHQAILEHNEQYQFEQGWMQGRQEARKETLIEVEKEYDKIITEDFSPEQLLAITHFYTRIKQQLQELGDK